MSKQSPNVEKLKGLHLKHDKGLLVIADDEEDMIDGKSPLNAVAAFCPANDTISDPIGLRQKAEEFCYKTRVVANKCKVFVGNVSYRVKSRELKQFFSVFGKVLFAQVINDRMKKRSRGFGFVTFSNEWEAQKAKDSTDKQRTLEDRVMKVCTPERKRKGVKTTVHETSLEEALEHYSRDSILTNKQTDDVVVDDCSNSSDTNKLEHRSPIQPLNEYTMLQIFSYLGSKDRIRVERVCRKWRLLAMKSWHHTTHLDFCGTFTSFKGIGGLTDEILWSILRRGCYNLRSLDLSASPHFLTDFAVHCIGKQCKQLKELDLSGVDVNTSSLKALSKGCPQLERIILQKCHGVGEKGLWWLFKNCKKLKHVDLAGNKNIKGQCFFMLSPSFESLHLTECTQLSDKAFIHLGEKCKNLDTIHLSECIMVTDSGLLQLTQHCFLIQRLKFSKPGPNVTSHGLQGLGNLSLLKELDISKSAAVNDEVLFTVGRSCIHLTSLNLESCEGDISDAGMQCLVPCYQLASLVISYLERVTGEGVAPLSANGALERFVARGCTSLTDNDVSGCCNITNDSLEQIARYCTSEDRPVLTWTVGGTAIDEEAISRLQQVPSRCQVSPVDLSVRDRIDAVPSYGSGKHPESYNVIYVVRTYNPFTPRLIQQGAFYREGIDEDEFDEFDLDEDEEDQLDSIADDDEARLTEDSPWWQPEDALDFLEADYPSLLAEQEFYRS